MALEEYQNILYSLIDIFAVLTVIFAFLLLYEIIKYKEKRYRKALVIVFLLVSIGFLFNGAAELAWSFISSILKMSPELGIPDILWIIGELLVLSGFAYFAVFMYKEYGKLKKGLTIIAIASIASASIIYYLISNFMTGQQAGKSAFEIFIGYFYPIASTLILISTLSVYLFFRELKEIGRPLILFALSRAFTFGGDTLYTYYIWNGTYGVPGVLSDGFYIIEYMLSALAFYLLLRRWAGIKSVRTEVKDIRQITKK